MIGLLEHYGLKERAEILISSMKNASVSKVTFAYLILRKVTNAMGLSLGGHPSMVRPLIAPMAEAAAVTENPSITDNQRLRVRAFAAVSENFGNFFSQLIFIGSGGLLLIKGVLNEAGYTMELDDMYVWALPSALASIIIFFIFSKIEQKKATTVLKASEESEC